MQRPFRQVDVFTRTAYAGNALAVVLDGTDLTDDDMQRFARWTNLSETTFVLPPSAPGADYQVRIFTPARELPFAGHPTLGTCHSWLEAGNTPAAPDTIVQQCKAGNISIKRIDQGLAFAAPPLVRSGPVDEGLIAQLAEMLRIERRDIEDAQWVDNGPGWVAVLLKSADAVLALQPGIVKGNVGVVGLYPSGASSAIEVRALYDQNGATAEDPVTGSLNASLAQWLLGSGRLKAPYVASQGAALGRAGRVHVSADTDGTIWIGGGSVTCISGQVEL